MGYIKNYFLFYKNMFGLCSKVVKQFLILILELNSSTWHAESYAFPSRLIFTIRSLAGLLIVCFLILLKNAPYLLSHYYGEFADLLSTSFKNLNKSLSVDITIVESGVITDLYASNVRVNS